MSSSTNNAAAQSNGDAAVRFPTWFLGHGAGPCFFLDAKESPAFEGLDKNSKATAWMKQLANEVGVVAGGKYGRPRALLVISAHWESDDVDRANEPVVRVTSQKSYPSLFYDYYGFPKSSYDVQYPAPGDPELAARVVSLLKAANLQCMEDNRRNLDHGVFVPLKLIFPDADIPVIQLSLSSSLDPAWHERIGAALAPLRGDRVLIIGSGMAGHGRQTQQQAQSFIDDVTAIIESASLSAEDRLTRLANWRSLRYAAVVHPREEHLIPLHVVAGAAQGTRGRLLLKDAFFGGKNIVVPLHTYLFDN